jgi:ankyrin repeat protein
MNKNDINYDVEFICEVQNQNFAGIKAILRNNKISPKVLIQGVKILAEFKNNIPIIEYLRTKGLTDKDIKKIIKDLIKINKLTEIENLMELKYIINKVKDLILDTAAIYGNLDILKYAVKIGAKLNNTESKAIYNAINHDKFKAFEYIYNNGYNKKANRDGLFIYSCEVGKLRVAKYLENDGANKNKKYNAALEVAAKNGHQKVVEYLIDIKSTTKTSLNKAIDGASQNNHLDTVILLLKNGADYKEIRNYSLISQLLDDKNVIDMLNEKDNEAEKNLQNQAIKSV